MLLLLCFLSLHIRTISLAPFTSLFFTKFWILTLETTLHLQQFLPGRPLDHICRMNVEVLLLDGEEVLALHVAHLFFARDGHDFAFDLQDGRAIGELDAEAVAGEGEDVFFENEGFRLHGNELGEQGYLAGRCLEAGHDV
jgi:hypothetical protein